MFPTLTRRDFIQTTAIGFLPDRVFAADNCTVKTRYSTFNGFIGENGVKT